MNLKNTVFGGLNQLGEDCSAKEQVLVDGGLNYTVAKRGILAPIGLEDGQVVEVDFPFHAGIVRTDTYQSLGVMGAGYGLVQNHEVLSLTDVFAKESAARYVAAGAPNRGERIYVVMDTGKFFLLGNGKDEQVRNLFFITSSHDGSNSLLAYPSPVYVKDGTVLIYPDSRHGAIRIRHTKNVMRYVGQAEKLLGKLMSYWDRFQESFLVLSDAQITDAQAEAFLEEVYAPEEGDSAIAKRVRTEVFELFKGGRSSSMPYCKGTLLGLYFACAFHADNEGTVRKSKKRDANSAAIYSRLMGTQAQHKAEALAFCLKLRKSLKGVR